MRIIEKLMSLIGVKVVDSSTKTTSQELLDECLKKEQQKPILVNRYSPKNNLER